MHTALKNAHGKFKKLKKKRNGVLSSPNKVIK